MNDAHELRHLDELALDLRWSWHHSLDTIWSRINPELWEATRNPWLVLRSIGPSKLEILASDEGFVQLVQACWRDRAAALESPTWFRQTYPQSNVSAAYFSMEYGLTEALPMYAGGLGVLAGDYLKAASDLGVPVVAIGLFYQQGYFRQVLDASGAQMEFFPPADPHEMPLVQMHDFQGAPLRIAIEFPARTLYVRAWRAQIGRISLYLLDTNDSENTPPDRGITAELYGGGEEMRMQQELVLGIGGWRLLDALGIRANVAHLNEGHAAFVVLERARSIMERDRVPFDVALTAARPGNVFTTHTPVAAGFDRFEPRLVREYLGAYAGQLGITIDDLLKLGQGPGDEAFMPANLAVRTCGAVMAVSRRHGEVSRQLFAGLFPRWPLAEIPVGYVTNGVHTPSWDSRDADRVWTDACGKNRWREDLSTTQKQIAAVDPADLWGMRMLNRAALVEFVRERLPEQLSQSGATAEQRAAVQSVLDPNVLTLGFARRFTAYKRPMLLLHDPGRLVRLLNHAERPVQLVIAGKAHPNDPEGKAMVHAWTSFVRREDVRARAVFLSDYDLRLAEKLVQGVDLWINTPQPPMEACGTSGMKVLVNGGLNFSELDGWWAEAYTPEVGWALGGESSDAAAAELLYDKLETEIVPAFYARDADDIPAAWVERIRASMSTLAPQFSTNRMLREYVERYYLGAAASVETRSGGRCAVARQIAEWERTLDAAWPQVHFGTPRITAGPAFRYDVPCYLGSLDPRDVAVELYADDPVERHPLERVGREADGATLYRLSMSTERPIADFTPRALPRHAGVTVPMELSRIAWLH